MWRRLAWGCAGALVVVGCAAAGPPPARMDPQQYPPYVSADVWVAPPTNVRSLDGAAIDSNPSLEDYEVPAYPTLALKAGIEGLVQLDIHVAEDGGVIDVDVVKSRATHTMEQSALKTARAWRFDPARRGETPVACRVEIAVHFALQK